MPLYISLINYTQQGIENMKDGPDRLETARRAIENAGGELTAFFLTMGQYDAVAITELPNDEVAATVVLAVAGQGNISTQTMRAFSEDEYRAIVANLP